MVYPRAPTPRGMIETLCTASLPPRAMPTIGVAQFVVGHDLTLLGIEEPVAFLEPDGMGGDGAPGYISTSGSVARSFRVSAISVMVASVSRTTLATETAFSRAIRTTLVGSTIPASRRST